MSDRFGFQKFVNEIHVAHTEEDLTSAASRMVDRMGFRWIAYLSLTEPSKPQVTSTYSPRWVSHYFENNFDKIDPCVLASRNQDQPFRWGALTAPAEVPANVVRLYDDASAYGIRAGITIPILGPNGRWSAFTMATDEEDTRTLGAQADEIPGLMIMTAVQFHTRLTALATRFMAPTRPNILTEPQTAVLQKCAEGSTMRNIAEDLGISHRGVIKHVVLARKRLQAKNVTHAVKIAIDLGLIH